MYQNIISLMAHSTSGATYPQFIAAGSVAYDGADPGSITPTIPSHQANDIIIVAARQLFNDTIDIPSGGWTLIEANAGGVSSGWWWKRATNGSTTAPTIEATRRFLYGLCYVIRGCRTSGDPYEDLTAVRYQTGLPPYDVATDPYAGTVTTTGANRLVTCFMGRYDDISWATPPPPAGWTALEDDVLDSNSDGIGFSVTTLEQAAAATVLEIKIGTYNSGSSLWSGITVAFVPA